jgi:ActR/RegA family two-component response regulator
MKARILLVDDEETLRFTFEQFLVIEGYETAGVGSCDEALSLIKERDFDLIFADILLGDGTGMDILRAVKEKNPTTQVVMITGHPTVETASDAVRHGAFEYLPKPVSKKALLHSANMALRHKAALDENIRTRTNLEAIMRSVSDAIITVDSELNLLEVNGPAEKLCGIDRRDIGQVLSSASSRCERGCIDAIRTSMKENRRFEIPWHACGAAGRVVNMIASPAGRRGQNARLRGDGAGRDAAGRAGTGAPEAKAVP